MLAYFFLYTALFFVLISIVFMILIVGELQKKGIKINYFLIRILIIKYVAQYKKITKEETGRVGSLYYLYLGTINLALFFAIIGIILKVT